MKKRIFSFLLCISTVICLLVCAVPTVSAAVINKGKIEIATVEGITGDSVIVPIKMTENPGVMAVTVSITYDSSILKYEGFYYGNIFSDYTVVEHPERNLIRLVICDRRNKLNDGKIISFKFKIAEDAKAELTKIDMKYSKGDFCNWNSDKIMPEITSGGVNVAFNGKNCAHKNYGDWTVITEPVCEEVGVRERICEKCGHTEFKEIAAIGHTYSDKWTVDKPATADKDGTMSRYCIRCDDFVDRVTFSLEQSNKDKINNEIWGEVTDPDIGGQLFKEQNPDKELTENEPTNNNGEDIIKNPLDVEEIIGEVIPEAQTPDGETMSVLDKISEVFPNHETLINIFKIVIVVLLIIIIL